MKKKKIFLIVLWIIIIGSLFTLIINMYMILSTKNRIVELDKLEDVDAILILGCKVEEDIPSLMLARRLERGIDVYNKIHKKIIVSGDSTREDYDEVGVMEDYLLTSISKDDLILDKDGITTYDSLLHTINKYGFKKIVIITQRYHMYRALYLANKLGISAYGVTAADIPQKLIMVKNHIREIFARDKNFFKGIIKPNYNYGY